VPGLARIESVRRRLRVVLKQRGYRITRRERAHLFNDESQQYGKKSHAVRRAFLSFTIVS
jgi:predicted DCC family thiol-disulfide oxidoreductase YuxK